MSMKYGAPIQIKEFKADGDDWLVSGYASTFGNVDLGYDVVMPGAFKNTLASGRRVSFLHSHDPRLVLGRPVKLKEDKAGLFGEFKISKTQLGQDTRELLMDDALGGFSIGYSAKDYDFSENGDVRQLKEIELYEVSVVAMPMNEQAVVTNVKDYWPGMTLVEKAAALHDALAQLTGDLQDVSQAGDRPLNQTKRQEIEALLETFSGLDDVRTKLSQLLAAAEPLAIRPVEQYLLRQKLAGYLEQIKE